ncbi:hypothetical protein NAT51_16115 [Flavobacterium amniphilum]|uniref:hypothetical protein n=1 Tax=Flavobacterium amniphilum TaxID=1834035 RepID=UPI002029C093|nr:hypothetical protein [Flavobacterium amniphilum]MCL9807061.1 hypothetical protein [Flavobacterium amniphilum]
MSQVIDTLKYAAKLSSISVFSFIKINFLNVISTLAIIIFGYIFLSENINPGASAHVSPIPYLIMIYGNRPVGTILWLIAFLAGPVVLFIIGNKYIMTKVINRLISDKSDKIIYPLMDKFLLKFKRPVLLKTAGDFSVEKMKLIQNIKNETENKILKKVIVFGMEKIKVDDIDFNDENLDFNDIIKTKTIQVLSAVTEPSRNLIWLILGSQWLIVLFIYFTKW